MNVRHDERIFLPESTDRAAEWPPERVESLVQPPDWEALIAEGAVPALVLGAERRLQRA